MIPPNGMLPQHMNSMHRPQAGNLSQQLPAKILDDLRRNPWPDRNGWQHTCDIKLRASRIFEL